MKQFGRVSVCICQAIARHVFVGYPVVTLAPRPGGGVAARGQRGADPAGRSRPCCGREQMVYARSHAAPDLDI